MMKKLPPVPQKFSPVNLERSVDNLERNGSAPSEPVYTIDDAVSSVGFGKFQIQLLFLSGLGWCADAFELIVLSLIGTFISCEWELERWQNALLTSIVFLGIVIGSWAFGWAADTFGRKKILLVCMVLIFIFGSLSAASPSFVWLVVLRCFTGFALGGVPQTFTLCSEYNPSSVRGRVGFYLCYFWSAGTVGVNAVAWVVMKYLDSWRILLVVVAAPFILVSVSLMWYPESARYFLVSNQYEKAKRILQKMAEMNRRPLPCGRLVEITECSKRGRLRDLFSKEYRFSAILFMYIWFAATCSYYAIAFISPTIISYGNIRNSETQINSTQNLREIVKCTKLTDQDYIDLIWTTAAEFPGILLFSVLVDKCGRRVLLGVASIINSILVFLLLLNTEIKIIMLLCLFGARALLCANYQLVFVMTAETFPTTVRSVAMGAGNAVSKLGGIFVLYIAQVLVITQPVAAVSLFGGIILLQGISAFFLSRETRGAEMLESHTAKK